MGPRGESLLMEPRCCHVEQVTASDGPAGPLEDPAGGEVHGGRCWLTRNMHGLLILVLEHRERELCSRRMVRDKKQSATNRHDFHSKNTIKGCVLRSWAWEPFPPTLLQHESLGYHNCSWCGCPAEDAVRSGGRKGNCSAALPGRWRVTKKRKARTLA